MVHELKILPRWFNAVAYNHKNFEIRKNDREFSVGDWLVLCEYEKGRYTGRAIERQIEYIYYGDGTFGLLKGWCVLGF